MMRFMSLLGLGLILALSAGTAYGPIKSFIDAEFLHFLLLGAGVAVIVVWFVGQSLEVPNPTPRRSE